MLSFQFGVRNPRSRNNLRRVRVSSRDACCVQCRLDVEKLLGVEHPDTLTSVNNLASVLRDQGKYEAAEEMNRRALEGREKVLGVEHPDTLTSVYSLAYLFHHQQRYNDASVLYLRASAGFSKTLGPDHPTTRSCSYHYSSMIREMEGQGRDV